MAIDIIATTGEAVKRSCRQALDSFPVSCLYAIMPFKASYDLMQQQPPESEQVQQQQPPESEPPKSERKKKCDCEDKEKTREKCELR